jgi:hypothetical protein
MTYEAIHVREEKSNGVASDTYTGGVDNVNTLNTVKYNSITGASLSGNQVTLPAGTYEFVGCSSFGQRGRLSLYDATNSAYIIKGIPNPILGAAGGPHFHLRGIMELADTTAVEMHIRPNSTTANVACSFGSDPEVYGELMIRKVG